MKISPSGSNFAQSKQSSRTSLFFDIKPAIFFTSKRSFMKISTPHISRHNADYSHKKSPITTPDKDKNPHYFEQQKQNLKPSKYTPFSRLKKVPNRTKKTLFYHQKKHPNFRKFRRIFFGFGHRNRVVECDKYSTVADNLCQNGNHFGRKIKILPHNSYICTLAHLLLNIGANCKSGAKILKRSSNPNGGLQQCDKLCRTERQNIL